MKSIRRRLLLVLGLGILLLTGGGSYVLTGVVRDALEGAFDEALQARAREVESSVVLELDPDHRRRITQLGAALSGRLAAEGREPEREAARAELAALAAKGLHLRVLDTLRPGDGEWIRIEGADGAPLAEAGAMPAEARRDVTIESTSSRFATEAWTRVWNRILPDDSGIAPRARITVVRDARELEQSLAAIRNGLFAGSVLLALAAALLAWLASGRVLAPLDAVGTRVQALDAGALDQRLPTEGVPAELAPIVGELNAALDRIELAFERERRLTGELAHELRTPIAELQTITDVARRWPDDADIQARCIRQGHDIARHMARVVNALLRVARAESGELELATAPLALREVIDAAWARLATTTDERAQSLANQAPATVSVASDGEVLDAILTNLLQNAAAHAPRGSTVRTHARTGQGGSVELVIANPRPADAIDDVPPEGLGLPLVAQLARALDITFTTGTTDDGFEALLRFPPRATPPSA